MPTHNMQEKVLSLLESVRPDIRRHLEKDWVADGILDSLDIMGAITALEGAFSIEIEPGDVNAENFCSLEAVVNLVKNYAK